MRANRRMRATWRTILCCSPLLLLASTSGCAHLGARPWERDQLARQQMQVDPDPIESSLDDHIYFSKEASSGGRGVGGGGCGCN